MYEFWYHYIKEKSNKKAKLCYIDLDSFIIQNKTKKIKDIANDLEGRLDT